MNNVQINELAMSQSVLQVLEAIMAAGGVPVIPDKSTALKTLLNKIPSLVAIQALPTTGKTEDRDRVLGDAIKASLIVAGSVLSYANANKLGDLAAKVRLTVTDFTRVRLAERVTLMQLVHDAATGVVTSLAGYGVAATNLTELQAKIDAAKVILGTPRSMIIARRVATEKIATTLDAINALIKDEIDPLMFGLQESNPDDYAAYQAARVVIDRPGTGTLSDPEPTPTPNPAQATAATTPASSIATINPAA